MLGAIKVGKSSLVNSLLKIPILHYDIDTATSFIIFIGYHEEEEPKLYHLKKKKI